MRYPSTCPAARPRLPPTSLTPGPQASKLALAALVRTYDVQLHSSQVGAVGRSVYTGACYACMAHHARCGTWTLRCGRWSGPDDGRQLHGRGVGADPQ